MIKDFRYVHLKTDWSLPSTRANVTSGENIAVSMGKLAKWYNDFKPWVFANPTRNDLVPVTSKTFTGIIASANNQAKAIFYFGKIVPTTFDTPWHIKYRVRVYVPSHLEYYQSAIIDYYGHRDDRNPEYHLVNSIRDTASRSAYYHTFYRAKEAGITGGYGHLIGECIYASTNPTNTDYKRTFEIDILATHGCTFTFFDNVLLYENAPGTGTTNYNTLVNYNFTTTGFLPDTTTDTYDRTRLNEIPIAGSNGVKNRSLVAYNNVGKLESFTTSSGTGTSKSFYTTAKFIADPVIMYYNGTVDIASGAVIAGASLYPEMTGINMQYSANVTTSVGFAINKIVFLEIAFDSDGYWHPTANGYVQEGAFVSGKYYIHIGVASAVNTISMGDQHPILYWDGTKFISRDDHDYAKSDHTHNVFTTTTNGFVPAPTSSNTGKFLKGDGTWATPSNTDTKVNVVTRGTTKAYLLATTTSPTSTATAVTSVAETGVYLDTTAGKLVATSFSGNGSALTNLNASNLASGTVPIARIPTGTSSTTVALGNHTHSYAGSASAGGAANSVANKLSVYYNTTKAYDYDGSAAKSLTIKAGSNVTVTGNTNGEITIAATNTNTDTKVTQAYSTTNNSYPLLMSATAGITSTSSRGDTTAILNNRAYLNPSTGILYAGGVIATQTSDTEAKAIRIESSSYNFGLHIGSGGENHGIYDFNKGTSGAWVIYSNDATNAKDYHLNGTATALGTAPGTRLNVGSTSQPVYFSNGVPVACSSTFGIYAAGTGLSLSGNTFNHSNSVTAKTTQGLYPIAYDAQGHITASGSAVTTLKNPTALTLKYGTTTAWTYDGSAAKTITIKAGSNVTITGNTNGEITIAATNTNTDTKVTQAYSTTNNTYPVLLSSVAGISSTSSRGDQTSIVNNQIYANPSNGRLYANIPEAFLFWGGKDFSGSYGPIDAAMIPTLSANRAAFYPGDRIVVEYTRDGGTTWLDYGATDATKTALFTTSTTLVVGKSTTSEIATSSCKLRITIKNTFGKLYSLIQKIAIYVSTGGSQGCTVDIKGRTRTNVEAESDTWADLKTAVPISGYSGWNILQTSFTTYGNASNKSSQYDEVRFIFSITGHTSTAAGLSVSKIYMYGGVGWNTPSTMAKEGLIYTYDTSQNVVFPAKVTSTSITTSSGDITCGGTFIAKADVYTDTLSAGALNMRNSDIYGCNSIKFADLCESGTEGIQFYRDGTHADSFYAKNGNLYFHPNRAYGTTTGSVYTVLHSGNVSVSQTITSGTEIGSITIAGTTTKLYYTPTGANQDFTLQHDGTQSWKYNGGTARTLNIKGGTNVTVTGDTSGNITISATDTTYTGTSPISVSGTAISIANASTSAKGAVQLSSAVDSTSTSLAATPSAVKSAYDLAASKSTVAFSRSLTSGTKIGTITIDGTATDIYCQTNTNTDTKVNVVTRGTTKAYLLATTTTPTSTATAVTSVAETGVYLDTTAGKLVATSFSGNGSALTNLNASNLASGTVPIARIPTGTSSTTVALGNHTHNYAGSSSPGGSATQAETVKSTLNQGLDGDGLSVTEIVWTSQGSSTGYKDLSINDGLQYQTRAGSTSREGLSRLVLGNGTAKGTANNKSGGILVYGSTTKYALITPPDTGFSDDRTLVLPDASGTICLTSHTHSNVSTSAAGFAPKITNTSGYLKGDGTWAVPPDTNTTYTFATGTANGKFKVTPSSGSAYEVAIYGLGSAAYTASTAYLASTTKYAASDSVGGPANQAKQLTGTLNQGHDGESLTVTDITWTTQISGTGYKDLSINDGLQYHTRSGTTTREGLSKVVIGNNIALGTANNKSGGIIIYGCTSTSADIVPPSGGFTASRTLTLPDASGTICLTNHTHNYAGSSSAGGAANSVANKLSIYYNTTKAYDYDGSSAKSLTIKGGTNVTVTGNANGEITIASSYTNTDTKVTQAYSTTNNSYPLLMTATAGVTSTSSRGDTTSILNNRIYANPSTGTVYAGGIIVTQTSDTETKAIRIESPTFNFGLHIGASGNNHGIYDFNKVSGSSTGDWIIYSNDATNTKDYHLKGSAAALGTAPGTLTSKGSATNPVYFSSGVPVACTYSLNKTVPSDAVFTDTKVTQNNSTTSAEYRVLLSYSASNTNETNIAYKSGNLTFNPNTRVVTGGKYVATWTSYPNQFTQLDGDGLRVAHGDTGGWSKGISFYTNTSMSSADCVIGYFRSSSGAASSYAYFGNSSSDTWFQVADHGYARLYGNRLYISNNPDAVIAHLYGKDSDKHEFPMIGYNATNVWIGANASVGYHHVGGTYISAGYEAKSDTDPTNARNSILVSVPESVSPTSSSGDNKDVYNWEVMHAGCNRYLGHCTTATATADKIVTTAEGHFKRVIGSVISVVFDNAVNASCTLNIDGTGAYSIIVSNNSSISRTIISASEAAIFQVSSGYYIFLGCSTAGSHCVQTFVSSTSSYTNWRPLLVGNSSGQYISTSFASSKGVTYAFNSIRCRPSSGTVAASTFVSTSQALLFSGAYSASDAVQTVTISVTSLFVLYSNVMAVIVTKSYGTINCVLPLAYIKAQGTSGFYEIGAATTTNTSYHLNATYSNDNTLLIKNGTMPSSNSIISVKLIAM